MAVTTLDHYDDKANPLKESLILRPGKQQDVRYLQVSAPYAFWLLMFVAMFIETASAQQAKEGGRCYTPNLKNQIVVSARGQDGIMKLYTKSCTCSPGGWMDHGQNVYVWYCAWD